MKIEIMEGDVVVKIPKELASQLKLSEGQGVELIPITKDVLVLVFQRSKKKGLGLSSEEVKLLQKLNAIRFSERTGNRMKEQLTKDEMRVLNSLVKKGVVLHMVHGKYKDKGGVYSISREYFHAINQMVKEVKKHQENQVIKDMISRLNKQGYLVIEDQKIAEELAMALTNEMESGTVTALKAWDKKIFFVLSSLVNELGDKVIDLLSKSKRGMSVQTIASKLKRDPDSVRAVIEILREAGDIIEKRKGIYTVA